MCKSSHAKLKHPLHYGWDSLFNPFGPFRRFHTHCALCPHKRFSVELAHGYRPERSKLLEVLGTELGREMNILGHSHICRESYAN